MLIIFDCDGVLVDSEPLAAEAMSGVLAEFGVTFPPSEIMARCVGLSLKDILALIERETGAPMPGGVTNRIWPATRALFAQRLQPMPGLVDFLRTQAGPRCVASSSLPDRLRFSLEVTGLQPFFGEDYFSSALVPRGKPAPDLFLHAAAAMHHAPEQCLVIEDSVAGVTAAIAAGMRVIGFAGGGHVTPAHVARLREAGSQAIVPHWSQMAEAIGG